ncbi:hypothetical protein SAMN06296952_2258 [Oscillospiraceae bacterium]|nr:hypothetical protein SAMN06296952_2258 [Oscillospiraceae bacterium]
MKKDMQNIKAPRRDYIARRRIIRIICILVILICLVLDIYLIKELL